MCLMQAHAIVLFFLGIVVDCMELLPINNGSIVLSNTTYLSVAIYECHEGFLLQGEDARICTSSGVWSGVEPMCQCKLNPTYIVHTLASYPGLLEKTWIQH